mmetsp:Transcript_41214/g.129124  ORF Transcript_41214/g.129124 Transcript_41214/m.129124 type:complete len:265 (-) Transcript_41214:403-1197(-)
MLIEAGATVMTGDECLRRVMAEAERTENVQHEDSPNNRSVAGGSASARPFSAARFHPTRAVHCPDPDSDDEQAKSSDTCDSAPTENDEDAQSDGTSGSDDTEATVAEDDAQPNDTSDSIQTEATVLEDGPVRAAANEQEPLLAPRDGGAGATAAPPRESAPYREVVDRLNEVLAAYRALRRAETDPTERSSLAARAKYYRRARRVLKEKWRRHVPADVTQNDRLYVLLREQQCAGSVFATISRIVTTGTCPQLQEGWYGQRTLG